MSLLNSLYSGSLWPPIYLTMGFTRWCTGKESTCQCRRCKRHGCDPWILEDILEEDMATHSSILSWKISWTEKTGWLLSMGYQRVGCNWVHTHTHTHTHIYTHFTMTALDVFIIIWLVLSSSQTYGFHESRNYSYFTFHYITKSLVNIFFDN